MSGKLVEYLLLKNLPNLKSIDYSRQIIFKMFDSNLLTKNCSRNFSWLQKDEEV